MSKQLALVCHVTEKISDPQTVKEFNDYNPRYSQDRNQLMSLEEGVLAVFEGLSMRTLASMCARVHKATGKRFKRKPHGDKILVGIVPKSNGNGSHIAIAA